MEISGSLHPLQELEGVDQVGAIVLSHGLIGAQIPIDAWIIGVVADYYLPEGCDSESVF